MALLISDLSQVTDPNSVLAYWNNKQNQQPPYLYQTLTRPSQINGGYVSEYFGSNQNITGLDGAADDTQAPRHNNEGFASDSYKILKFRSSKMMDETRLNAIRDALANHSNDQGFIQSLTKSQLDDQTTLLNSAQYTRERLFISELLTGYLGFDDSRLKVDPAQYNFHVPASHHLKVGTKWGNSSSSPIEDLEEAKRFINKQNGTTETIAIMNQTTMNHLAHSGEIHTTLFPNQSASANVAVNPNQIASLVTSDTNLRIVVYDKGDANGTFLPDDKVILIPNTNVGRMAWTQTNEALDQSAQSDARISNTADGITAETFHQLDPNGTILIVAEKVLPVLDASQNILTLDTSTTFSGKGNVDADISVDSSAPSVSVSASEPNLQSSNNGNSNSSSKGNSSKK